MLRRTAPAVLVTLLCALALFATTTATWIHADVPTSLQSVTVDVPGADAAPAVTALGLVAAVAAVPPRWEAGYCAQSWAPSSR